MYTRDRPAGRHLQGRGGDQGFRKAEKTGFELTPDGRITADFALVGRRADRDRRGRPRSAAKRSTGRPARSRGSSTARRCATLALSGRNYLELASLIPGAVQLDDDQMAVTTGLGTGGTVINGNRGNSNNLTVDGGFNLDSGSNGSMINNVGIDFIEQVAIQTSNFSADKGRNSGAVDQRRHQERHQPVRRQRVRDRSATTSSTRRTISRRGTPTASGSRRSSTSTTTAAASAARFGKNKLFFFGGVEFKSLDRAGGAAAPDAADAGGVARRFLGPDRDGRLATIPLTGQPFPGNIIPDERITADGRAIAKVYERDDRAGAPRTPNTPTANNTTYQLDFPFDSRAGHRCASTIRPSSAPRASTCAICTTSTT